MPQNNIIDDVIDWHNIERAYTKVRNYTIRQNLPVPWATELFEFAKEDNLAVVQKIIAKHPDTYNFNPHRLYYTLKSSGSIRMETTSSIFDRVLIQSVMNQIGPSAQEKLLQRDVCLGYWYQPSDMNHIYSFWPKAYKKWMSSVNRRAEEGYTWALHTDIQGFFHSIDRNRLAIILRDYVQNDNLFNIILRYLNFTYIDSGGRQQLINGLPIEEPSSRLLANLYMADFDQYVTQTMAVPYVRYVDDMVFFAHTKSDCLEIKHKIQKYLARTRNLYLNDSKTIPTPITDVIQQGGRRLASRLSALDSRVKGPLVPSEKKVLAHDLMDLLGENFPDTREDSRAKRFSSYRLAKLSWEPSAKEISKLLQRTDTRKMAAIGLAVMNTALSKTLLREYILSSSFEELFSFERLQCFFALLCAYRNDAGKFDYDQAAKKEKVVINHFLSDEDWSSRSLAVYFSNNKKSLIQAMQDDDPTVRTTAALAICRLKKISSKEVLPLNADQAGDFDSLISSLILKANINKLGKHDLDFESLFQGVPKFESIYAGYILLAGIPEVANLPNRRKLSFDLLRGSWALPQDKSFKDKVLAQIQYRARPFIDRVFDEKAGLKEKREFKELYSKVAKNIRKNRPATEDSIKHDIEEISSLIAYMESLQKKTNDAHRYLKYLKWQKQVLGKGFVNDFVKGAGTHFGLLGTLDDQYEEIAKTYGNLANRFEKIIKEKKSSADLLSMTEELLEDIPKLIHRIDSANSGVDDYRFESDLMIRTILKPSQTEVKNLVDKLVVEMNASCFPPIGEWHFSVKNLSNAAINISGMEICVENKWEKIILNADHSLKANGTLDDIYYASSEQSFGPKKALLRVKDTHKAFIVEVVETRMPQIYFNHIQHFPKPLMVVYQKIWQEKSKNDKYSKAIDAFKQLLHYTAFLLIGDALAHSGTDLRKNILQRFTTKRGDDGPLTTPSEGHWLHIILELIKEPFPSTLPLLRDAVALKGTQDLFKKLLEQKKQISHGAKRIDKDIPLTDCVCTLHDLYRELGCLIKYPLISLNGNYNNKTLRYEAKEIMGQVPSDKALMVNDTSFLGNRYGLFVSGEDEKIFPIEPFLRANDEDNWSTMQFYNKRSGKSAVYLDYNNGHFEQVEYDFDDCLYSGKDA